MAPTGDDGPVRAATADLRSRRARVVDEMGGVEKVRALHADGASTVRDRIAALVDPGSFREVGTFSRSAAADDRLTTPGDGKVGGHATIGGRPVTVAGDDITVKRASSSVVGSRKLDRLETQAIAAGNPFVYLGETGGARIPDTLGSEGFSLVTPAGILNHRQRRVPVATAIVGPSFGGSSFISALSDFVVQVRGSCLAVTSPRVIEIATGEKITMDELGGVDVHDRTTGQIDRLAETEEEAFALIREFLGYVPPNAWTAPERVGGGEPIEPDEELDQLVPERRQRAYDMHRVLDRVLDPGAFLELSPGFGRSTLTGLGRLDGHVVGVVASQPTQQAGVLGPAACDKVTRLLCLCDSFAIPMVFLQDCPGFLVGKQVEHERMLHKAIRLQQAYAAATTPKLTVLIRKAFGLAYFALGGTDMGADSLYAWPGAELSFMDPGVGVNVVHGTKLARLPEAERDAERARLVEELTGDTSIYEAAGIMSIDEVIDPARTRQVLAGRLGELQHRAVPPLAQRALSYWPTC